MPFYLMALPALVYIFINNYIPMFGIVVAMLFELIASGKWKTDLYTLQKAPLEKAIEKVEQLAAGEIDVARVLLMPNESM